MPIGAAAGAIAPTPGPDDTPAPAPEPAADDADSGAAAPGADAGAADVGALAVLNGGTNGANGVFANWPRPAGPPPPPPAPPPPAPAPPAAWVPAAIPLPMPSPTDDEAADTAADCVSDEGFDSPAPVPRFPVLAGDCPISPVSGPAPLLAAPLSDDDDEAPPLAEGTDGIALRDGRWPTTAVPTSPAGPAESPRDRAPN